MMPEFEFLFRLEKISDRIVLSQPPRGLLLTMSNNVRPSNDALLMFKTIMQFVSGILERNVACTMVSMNMQFIASRG